MRSERQRGRRHRQGASSYTEAAARIAVGPAGGVRRTVGGFLQLQLLHDTKKRIVLQAYTPSPGPNGTDPKPTHDRHNTRTLSCHLERRPPSHTSLKVKDLALSTHRGTDHDSFFAISSRPGLAMDENNTLAHALRAPLCAHPSGVAWQGPQQEEFSKKHRFRSSTNSRQQQVERIGCSARARDGWRRGWHG